MQALPLKLSAVGQRAIQDPSLRRQRHLALGAQHHLAKRNIQAEVVDLSDTVVVSIQPTPLDPKKPVDRLTRLAKGLGKHNCALTFMTQNYLADIASFIGTGWEELGGQKMVNLPWCELQEQEEVPSATLHELKHFHQNKSRQESEPRLAFSQFRFDQGQEPDPDLGDYNRPFGFNAADEAEAYLFQGRIHEARGEDERAAHFKAESLLFSESALKGLESPIDDIQEDPSPHPELRGSLRVNTESGCIWLDSQAVQPAQVPLVFDSLRQDFRELREATLG